MRAPGHRRDALQGGIAMVVAAVVLGASAVPAAARTEKIRWRYAAPGRAAGFRIHIGPATGQYDHVIDAGKPDPNEGVFTRFLEVEGDQTVFVAVSAYAGDETSALSNETRRTPSGNPGGLPSPPPEEPEVPEDRLTERFGSYEIGGNPTGWLDTGPGSPRGADGDLFSVGRVRGNRVLETSSTLSDIHSHYVTSKSAGWSRYEFRGRMRLEDPDGGIGVTVLSQFPDRDAYYRVRRTAGDGTKFFHIAPRPEGYPLACDLDSTGVTPRQKRWYRFRVQVAAEETGTTVRAKVWRNAADEPKHWDIRCTDTSAARLTQGVPGVWSSGPGAKQWDDLKVIPLEPGALDDARPSRHSPPAKPMLID